MCILKVKQMKAKQIITLMIACTAMLLMTSCLNDSESNSNYTYEPYTTAEKAAKLLNMQGSYSGQIYYNINTATGKYDSTTVSAVITATDSLIRFTNVPMEVFTSGLDSRYKDSVKVNTVLPVLEATLHIYMPLGYNKSDLGDGCYYQIFPKSWQASTMIDFNGKQKLCTVVFEQTNTTYSSIGYYSKDWFKCNLVVKSVTIQGSINEYTMHAPLGVALKKQ